MTATATAGRTPRRRLAAWLHRHAGVRLARCCRRRCSGWSSPTSARWPPCSSRHCGRTTPSPATWSTSSTWATSGPSSPDVYRDVALRSVGVAAAVTVIDAVIALPMAFFMAKVASPRAQHWLVIAILTPLWASYLVKAYAWRVMLANGGRRLASAGRARAGTADRHDPRPVLPVAAVHDPADLRRAGPAAGLAAGGVRRPRRARPRGRSGPVVLPMIFPAVIAGLDLHVLAVAGRLHHRADRRRQVAAHRQPRLRQHRRGQQPAVRRRAGHRSRWSSWWSTCRRSAAPAPWRSCEPLPVRPARSLRRGDGCLGLGRHLRAAGHRAAQLVQRRPHVRLAAARPHRPSGGSRGLGQRGRATRCGRRSRPGWARPRSRWCSARWWRSRCQRYRFFGRNAVSLLVVLPIALPGIVTGIALDTAFRSVVEPLGVEQGTVLGDRRARDVLRGGGLQQRARPAAAASAATSRRRRADLGAGHVPDVPAT